MTSFYELQTYLADPEGAHLEFKEAKNSFEFEKLVEYCVAIANEGGGQIILGVTDKIPRRRFVSKRQCRILIQSLLLIFEKGGGKRPKTHALNLGTMSKL